jgi:hypothetical protein
MKRKILYAISFLLVVNICCRQNRSSDSKIINTIDNQNPILKSELIETKNQKNDTIGNVREKQNIEPIHASEDCKIEDLVKLRNNIDNLDEAQVLSFLESFNETCALNIEYSEFSNYLLFQLLREQPKLVLKVLTENESMSYTYINKNLKNPINDTINLEIIYYKIDAVDGYDTAKKSILTSIKEAMNKY